METGSSSSTWNIIWKSWNASLVPGREQAAGAVAATGPVYDRFWQARPAWKTAGYPGKLLLLGRQHGYSGLDQAARGALLHAAAVRYLMTRAQSDRAEPPRLEVAALRSYERPLPEVRAYDGSRRRWSDGCRQRCRRARHDSSVLSGRSLGS